MNKKQKEILERYMADASPQEAAELRHLLQKKQQSAPVSSINIGETAKEMAQDLQESMGLTQDNVKKMARDLVIDMALQYNPNMSASEIKKLIDEMVPTEDKNKIRLPADMILEMCRHIIEYNEGTMEPSFSKQLPQNWIRRYLASLPDDIQKVMLGYIEEKISIDECWTAVKALA